MVERSTSPRPSPHRLRRLRRRGEGETLPTSIRVTPGELMRCTPSRIGCEMRLAIYWCLIIKPVTIMGEIFFMRLWTIHPKHLDAKGLVALWREALLAQKVLQGRTRGYRHHPQLFRFQATRNPAATIASYLAVVHEESVRRGYR